MKHSIKKIFTNLSLFLFSITALAALGALAALDHSYSYSKIDNLKDQQHTIFSLSDIPRYDPELALIQFNGKSNQLYHYIDKLHTIYWYNFAERFLLSNDEEYLGDLEKLSTLTSAFNKKAGEYYAKENTEEKISIDHIKQSRDELLKHINNIIFKAIEYNEKKSDIHLKTVTLLFIIILLVSIWYRKRLDLVYSDIRFLYDVNNTKHDIFTQEVGAVSLRLKRKPDTSDNPAMLDPVTGINNFKGMISSYSEKKGMKEKNFTSVTVFEIDNFSKSNKAYSQELTQTILKKVAFAVSLYEQVTDVLARTDYNQFTVILSRESKEQLLKDTKQIKESISELKISSPELGEIKITISGGHYVKPNNVMLEEAIKEAKKILEYAKKTGGDNICTIKDIAHSEL